MSEFEQKREENPTPKKPKINVKNVTAFALVGILIVLVLSNLNALLSPIHNLSAILAPITLGLVLAYILNFFMRFFEYKLFNKIKKRTANRALSMLLSYILLLLIIAGFIWLIIPNLIESVKDLQANGLTYVSRMIDSINGVLSKIPFLAPEDGTDILNLEKLLASVVGLIRASGNEIFSDIAAFAGSTLTVLKNIIVGVFISIYVLLSKERLNAGCRRVARALLSDKQEKLILHYFSVAHKKVGGYLIGKIADSFIVMLVCMLLFSIFKIPYAILIAVIIGITDIIPFFGPFLGAIPSAIIIFIADPWKAVLFGLLILVVQQIDGNLIAPVILGDRTGLSSLGVIVAVTVMGGVFGITGMLIGVPLFALIMTLLDDFIKNRLRKKGETTDLKSYYPADAFIRPQDIVKNDSTLTQRFVEWVSAVETEQVGVDYTPSPAHTFGRGVRRVCLAIGRFFHRLFAVKPILADHSSGIFSDIVENGMNEKRPVWRTFLLSVLTLGIYPLYLVEVISHSINLACRKDKHRTWGFFPYLLFSAFSLGIFSLIWHCQVIDRMQAFCRENGKVCRTSKKFHLCWTLLGLLIGIGPLIALARFLSAVNQLSVTFNSMHTFPLSMEELEAEVVSLDDDLPRRQRQSIIEQIIDPPEPEVPAEEYADEEPPTLSADDEDYDSRPAYDAKEGSTEE